LLAGRDSPPGMAILRGTSRRIPIVRVADDPPGAAGKRYGVREDLTRQMSAMG